MAVCPLILNFLHISSQKWLVFANYFGLPNFLPQLANFFYTDISVTFSNSVGCHTGIMEQDVRITLKQVQLHPIYVFFDKVQNSVKRKNVINEKSEVRSS